jgi:putative nucleotidyltransferase with HDIG domain
MIASLAEDTRKQALRSLDKLPQLSPTVGQLLAALASADPDLRQLARIIGKDPALSGLVLSVANSAFFGGRSPVSDISEAINRVGLGKLRRLTLGQSFSRIFNFGRTPPGWSSVRFHLHSAAVGAASDILREYLPVPDEEHAFVAGLLHDLGKLLIVSAFPKEWRQLEDQALWQKSGVLAERELLGADHAELSALAVERWKLPSPVADAVARHHSPALESATAVPLSRLIHAADTFINSLGISVREKTPEQDPVLPLFNGHSYHTDAFAADFQKEWELLAATCFR